MDEFLQSARAMTTLIAFCGFAGAAFTLGIEHFPLGPSGPFIRINTGAVEVLIRGHATDIIAMSDAFAEVRKVLEKPRKKDKKRASQCPP